MCPGPRLSQIACSRSTSSTAAKPLSSASKPIPALAAWRLAQVRDAIGRRLAEIGLELHPDKTRIVYCKDGMRRLEYEQVSFTFCGYAFRPRVPGRLTTCLLYT